MSGHLALVVARVPFVHVRYAQLPIVWVLEQKLVTLVGAVYVVAERQQLHLVARPADPRDLRDKR